METLLWIWIKAKLQRCLKNHEVNSLLKLQNNQ